MSNISNIDFENLSRDDLIAILECKKEDILDNVVKALEIDGGLYGISQKFQFDLAIGRSDIFPKGNMTWQEFKDIYNSTPEDMYFSNISDMNTKEDVFRFLCINNLNAFIDFEKGECNFNTPEFAEMLDFVDRDKGYFEVMPKGSSKASAMEYVAEYLNIPMSQTVAIGDGANDIPMLEAAECAIVMGNAPEDVKNLADYVTTDVDKDGIWNALKWLGVI